MNQGQLIQGFVAWAKSKGIPAPTTPAGRQVLFARFMNELHGRMNQVIGAMQPQEAVGDSDPTLHLSVDGATVQIDDAIHEGYTDFDQLVHERNEAMRQAGGDDLAMNVIHRNQTRETDNANAPFTRINPPSWQGQNIGNQVSINATQTQEIVRWTGDPVENIPISVLVQAAPLAPPIGVKFSYGEWYRPYVVVQYGSRGGLNTVQVDVTNGRGFVVYGSQISVMAAMDPNQPSGDGSSSMLFTGMLSCYAAGQAVLPTRTIYFDGPNGAALTGAQPTVTIPANAVDFNFYQDPTGNGATLDFYNGQGNAGKIWSITVGAGASITVPIRLFGDANAVIVTPTGAGFVHARLVFGLSL